MYVCICVCVRARVCERARERVLVQKDFAALPLLGVPGVAWLGLTCLHTGFACYKFALVAKNALNLQACGILMAWLGLDCFDWIGSNFLFGVRTTQKN